MPWFGGQAGRLRAPRAWSRTFRGLVAQTKPLPQSTYCVVWPARIDTQMIKILATPSAEECAPNLAWRDEETDGDGAHVEQPRCVVVAATAPEFPRTDFSLANQRGVVAGGDVMQIVLHQRRSTSPRVTDPDRHRSELA